MSGHAPAAAPAADEHAAKPSMMPKLIVGGFISMVVVAETLIFFLMVPNGDDVAALAESRLIKKLETTMHSDGEEVAHEDEDEIVEFPLCTIQQTFVPTGSDRVYEVMFQLFGTIKRKDESHMTELFKQREGRFKSRLILEIRNATIDELTENQLGLIQRRILATSNEVLEEPILLGVGFHDYNVAEM